MSEILRKSKLERRARGLKHVTGQQVDIEWGYWPHTDGDKIYLPGQLEGTWDSEKKLQAAFDHELAHIMFDSDIPTIFEWIEMWQDEKIDVPNIGNVFGYAAKSVVNTIEDQRIESLYGDLFYGAGVRFQKVLRPALDYSLDTPASAFHAVRCGMGTHNPQNTYPEVKEKWGKDQAELFYNILEEAEHGTVQTTLYLSECVMHEIYPWYEDRVLQILKKDDKTRRMARELEDVTGDLEDDEKAERLKDRLEDEADEDDEELEEIVEEDNKDENDIKDEVGDGEEELPEEVTGDGTGTDNREGTNTDLDRDILDEWRSKQEEELEEIENKMTEEDLDTSQDIVNEVGTHVVKRRPQGVSMAKVYNGVVSDLIDNLRRIYGRREQRTSSFGSGIDINELIDSEITDELSTEMFTEDVLTFGFSAIVLVDTSQSMLGSKINVSRNIGATFFKAFDELETVGKGFDYGVIGFSGHPERNRMLIQEATTLEEARRIDIDKTYGATPTWHAVEYATNRLRKMNGEKFMVLITDGMPTGLTESGEQIPSGRALRYTGDRIDSAHGHGINTFTIGINVELEPEEMSRVYGTYTNVTNAQEAGEEVIAFFAEQLQKHMEVA